MTGKKTGPIFSIVVAAMLTLGLGFSTVEALEGEQQARKILADKGRVVICAVLAMAQPAGTESGMASLKQKMQACKASQDQCLKLLGKDGYAVRYRYRYSPVLALEIRDEDVISRLSRLDGVRRLRADQRGSATLLESRQLIRANQAQELGLSGAGRIVAVLDSGIDADHLDLQEGILEQYGQHFLDQGADTGEDFDDDNGHGTHVSGILASRGNLTPPGIAPGASIIPVKVLDRRNVGWFTDWAAGIEYVVDLHQGDNGLSIDVINMSLASHSLYEQSCNDAHEGIAGAVTAAHELGILVLAASGNNGSDNSLALPSCMNEVISVGSTLDTSPGTISTFTNRSARLDILAPGENIVSTGNTGGNAAISGTSQATPHISGAICLMLEANPGLTADQVIATLLATGTEVNDEVSGLSFPRVDCLDAVELVSIPPVTNLACTLKSNRNLLTTWDAQEDMESFEVSVLYDGTALESVVLGGEARQFVLDNIEPGSYELNIRSTRNEISGPLETCSIDIGEFGASFTRGNCNGDLAFDLTDAIFTLNLLFFAQGATAPCETACDANDDGELNITDAIYALSTLFLGTALPPQPYPGCGIDPSQDDQNPLSCEQASCLLQ
ncbi:MAG: S8 family serine peptidase [Planctomycetota bacterium]|nr:S8 family serine peptidase [Planctomycetota bacterium]